MARHTFFAELYGLNQNNRNAGAAVVNQALDSEQVGEVTERQVLANYPVRADTALLVNSTFQSSAAGQRIVDAAYQWARTRAGSTASGRISTLRLTTVDEVEATITVWATESPTWPVPAPEVRGLYSAAPG